jgi:hypothetical protein
MHDSGNGRAYDAVAGTDGSGRDRREQPYRDVRRRPPTAGRPWGGGPAGLDAKPELILLSAALVRMSLRLATCCETATG